MQCASKRETRVRSLLEACVLNVPLRMSVTKTATWGQQSTHTHTHTHYLLSSYLGVLSADKSNLFYTHTHTHTHSVARV